MDHFHMHFFHCFIAEQNQNIFLFKNALPESDYT